MSALSTVNANAIMNQVAVEVGLLPAAAPFGSSEDHFVQMRYLMQTAGQELLLAHPWETVSKTHSFTTDAGGEYALPDDFLYMVNQTGWSSGENRSLQGPATPQEWTYLSNWTAQPIRLIFRFKEGVLEFLGDDTAGETVTFEYISRNWVCDETTSPATYTDEVMAGGDIILFDRTLFSRYLKVKWQDSKGFDSSKAQDDFNQMFGFMTSKDKGAKILNAGSGGSGFRLLNGYNIPDTGMGM